MSDDNLNNFNPDNPGNYVMHCGVPLHVFNEQQSQAHQAQQIEQGKSFRPGSYTPSAPVRASVFFRNVIIWAIALAVFHYFGTSRWIPATAIATAVLLTIPAFRACAVVVLALMAFAFWFSWKYPASSPHRAATAPVAAHHHKPVVTYHHHK